MRAIALGVALALAGCGNKTDVRAYDNGLFELASGFSAKEVCSCLFVVGADEDHCREWTRVSPNVARFRVDREARTVTSKALGMGEQTARYVSEAEGCQLVSR